MIQGISIVLYEKTLSGYDPFNMPIYTEKATTVDNVLVGQPSTEEVTESHDLFQKKIEYMLGIPKGDEHVWEDVVVEFFGHKFRTFGYPIEGIEANIPLKWHKKVRVERYGDEV